MKFTVTTLAVFALGVGSVFAGPYYVGENLTPPNNMTLGFQETITKDTATRDRGYISSLDLRATFLASENIAIRAGLPFYMASKNVTGTKRSALGNTNIALTWMDSFTSNNKEWEFGYNLTTDAYFPTSRKTEGDTIAIANPTTDFYRFATKTTSIAPYAGMFVKHEMFSAKTNLGGAYMFRQDPAGTTDKHRIAASWQTGMSYHILPTVHLNGEYNMLVLDSASRGNGNKFRHAATPSVSAEWDSVRGALYASFPIDKDTRDLTNVASFGLNVGYVF